MTDQEGARQIRGGIANERRGRGERGGVEAEQREHGSSEEGAKQDGGGGMAELSRIALMRRGGGDQRERLI